MTPTHRARPLLRVERRLARRERRRRRRHVPRRRRGDPHTYGPLHAAAAGM